MCINSTKAPLDFSRLPTKKSGNELRKFKKIYCLIYLRKKTKWINKLPQLCIFFFYSTWNKLRDLWVCYFSQIKCGPSIRIFFFCLQAFVWVNTPVTSVRGKGSRWDMDNKGKITVLKYLICKNQTVPSLQVLHVSLKNNFT